MPSGVSPFPFLQVQVAFGSNPLSGSYTWNDISASVRNLNIQRGRQHVLTNFEAGRLTVTLDGRDGTFDPTNTLSTYYPNVTINKRVQVLAWWNLLSATDGANIPSGQKLYNCTQNPADGYLTAQAAGNMVSSSASGTAGFPVTPGATYYHQELILASSTARSCFATLWFYDKNGAWVASSNGATASDASSNFTTFTASAVAPSNAAYGSTGTTILSAASSEKHDNRQAQVAQASSAGTWYAGGGVPIFTGFVDAWTPNYADNLNTDIQMTATDGLRLLAQAAYGAAWPAVAATDGASNAWLLNDAASSLVAVDVLAGQNGAYSAGVTTGSATGPSTLEVATAASFTGNAFSFPVSNCALPIGTRLTGTGAFSVEAWVRMAGSSVVNQAATVYRQSIGITHQAYVSVYADASSKGWGQIYDGSAAAIGIGGVGGALNDGVWHQMVLVRDSSGTSASMYTDGGVSGAGSSTASSWVGTRNVDMGTASGAGVWIRGSDGFGADELCPIIANVALYPGVALTAAQVLNHYTTGKNYLASSDSATFTSALLSMLTWPNADRSIAATGYSNIPSPTATINGQAGLSYLQSVATAENGALFVNGSGQVVFQNRYTVLTGPNNVSLATFGDAGTSGEIPYARSPTIAIDNIDLYEASLVTRTGGSSQYSSNSTAIATYGASSSPYIASTLVESGLLITTDAESLSRAQWNVGHYSTPLTRVRGITVNVLADPTNTFPKTVFRELRDRVTVARRPYNKASGWPATQFQQDSYLEGIAHNIDAEAGTWTVDLACSPSETQSYWILDDNTYSVLDSTTRLAY